MYVIYKHYTEISLRSKRFRLVSEQRKTEELSRSSFYAPKPHGNACYAGYAGYPETMESFVWLVSLHHIKHVSS